MEWFKRMYFSIILVCITLGNLSIALNTKTPSDRCILIKAQVADRDDIATLANMGLDIWEYHDGSLVIRVTDDERKQVIESGFVIETITENVYEYTEKISQDQISMLAEPATAKYHSYDEVINELIALEDSGVAQTHIIGRTHEGRDIWAVKISDNPSEEEEEPGAVFLGCHHAREWISVEVPLYIAQYLTDNYDSDTDVKHLVDNSEIWIVPVVNPDGYEYSRTHDRLWRKNRRDNGDGTFGVDLNRNYDSMWGTIDAPTRTSAETYRGPSAFSEPETQAIRDLVRAYDFRILMSYHSFWQAIYYPWGYTWEPPLDGPIFRDMTSSMIELIYNTSGATYTNWFDMPDTYLLSGDTGDWSYGELGIYSFGIELRPVTSSQGGFRLPENQIIPTCEENLPVALYLISYAAADNGIENLATGQTYSNIQLAINYANDGDEIVVNPGVYHENISFVDKNLTLRSIDPNDPNVVAATVINIEDLYQGPVITMSGSRNGGCLLDGLTITGGRVSISCGDAYLTLRNCLIESKGPNAIEFWEFCQPTLIDCNVVGQVVEVNDPTLIAHWAMDETEGIYAVDSVGVNDAVVVGGFEWLPTGGQIDGALNLDGVSGCVITGTVLNPANGPFSVLAWVNGGAPGQVVVSQQNIANWLAVDAEGNLMTELKGVGRFTSPLFSVAVITDGQWHRISLIWDGSNRTLCVDGAAVAEDTRSGLGSSTNGLYIGVGKDYAAETFFSGLIDDIRIYNRVVSP
jgi:carboxypeptidase T